MAARWISDSSQFGRFARLANQLRHEWRRRIESTGNDVPHRVRSCLITTAGVAAISAVPEPSTTVLLLGAVVAMVFVGASETGRTDRQFAFQVIGTDPQGGAQVMSRRLGWCVIVLVCVCHQSASAVTQGIPLVNNQFRTSWSRRNQSRRLWRDWNSVCTTDPVVTLSSGQLAGGIPGWTFTGGDGGVGEVPGPAWVANSLATMLPGDSARKARVPAILAMN